MIKNILLTFICCLSFSIGYSQNPYDINSVRDIKITFQESNWEDILDSLKMYGKDRLIGKIQYNGVSYDSVGIRYKGNSSYYNVKKYGSSKLPFNIKLNHVKKGQALPSGHKTLKLSNVFRDPSFLREVLSYEIAGKYMPASQANFVRVYVNDQLLGLYNNTESVDKKFLKKHFGYSKGTFIKCDPDWQAKQSKKCPKSDKASLNYLGKDSLCYQTSYELKSKYGWTDLLQLTKTLSLKPENIESVLNVDRTLWMLAFNNVLVNLDSYSGRLCHNYYLYKDSFGIFQPIVWDMNLSFGGFRFDGTGGQLDNAKMQKLSPFTHYKTKSAKWPLITKLLSVDLYRKIYVAHIKTILEENFTNYQYQKRASDIQRSIDYYVKNDENKLYDYNSFKENVNATSSAGKSKIIGITELMNERSNYLKNHPLLKKIPPKITEVNHQHKEDQTLISARVTDAKAVYLCHREVQNGIFKRQKMSDEANDGKYALMIPKKIGTQYYIIAEGEKIAGLSPEKAAFEFYEVKY